MAQKVQSGRLFVWGQMIWTTTSIEKDIKIVQDAFVLSGSILARKTPFSIEVKAIYMLNIYMHETWNIKFWGFSAVAVKNLGGTIWKMCSKFPE